MYLFAFLAKGLFSSDEIPATKARICCSDSPVQSPGWTLWEISAEAGGGSC